jgi:hypothetical protein
MKNSSVFGIAFVAFALLTGQFVKGNGPEKLFQILIFGGLGACITTELFSVGKTVSRMTRREEPNNHTVDNYARSQAIAAQNRLRINGTGNPTTVIQTEDYTPDIWEIPQLDVIDYPSSEPDYPTYSDNNWDDQTPTVTSEVQTPEPVYQAPVETPQQDSTPSYTPEVTPAPTYEAPSYTPDPAPYTPDPSPSYSDYGSSYTDTTNY